MPSALALAWRDATLFSCSVGERKIMNHFVVENVSAKRTIDSALAKNRIKALNLSTIRLL
jgi:hypothetical protein